MLGLESSNRFKRDLKLCQKRGYDLSLLQAAVNVLRVPAPLPEKNRDHLLTGDYAGYRECHIQPDWLLVYFVEDGILHLARTGTHADLFS